MGAFRGRGRLLAGARVPPEPSRRALLVCYMLARRARRSSVGRGFPRGQAGAYAFSDVRSQRHRSKPTSITCRRRAEARVGPPLKRPKTAERSAFLAGRTQGEDHHLPAPRREGRAHGSPGRRRGKPQPTATPTRAEAGTLRACLPTHATRNEEQRDGGRRHQVRHQPTARRPTPS